MSTDKELKKDLGLDESNPIPADYQIPFFVHQDDMNRLDHSHKRVEKWLIILCIIIFIAFVGTNAYWVWYEQQYQDVVVTETTQDGNGVNVIGTSGDIDYGTKEKDSEDKG